MEGQGVGVHVCDESTADSLFFSTMRFPRSAMNVNVVRNSKTSADKRQEKPGLS